MKTTKPIPAYYNEINPHAERWLRELINDGILPPGHVDNRSITDVTVNDLKGYHQCHFFAGIGGWPYALRLAGIPNNFPCWTGSPPCQPFSAAGKGKGTEDARHLWPQFFDLIKTLRPPLIFGEQVAASLIIGPTRQPSASKQAGRGGKTTAGRAWIDTVFDDLEAAQYACGAQVLPACAIGAFHRRDRLWWVAQNLGYNPVANSQRYRRQPSRIHHSGHERTKPTPSSEDLFSGIPDTRSHVPASQAKPTGHDRAQENRSTNWLAGYCSPLDANSRTEWIACTDGKHRPTEPGIFPLVNGLSSRMVQSGYPSAEESNNTAEARNQRLHGYGNAIVPQLAAEFIRICLDAI